jgi:beta-lactamase regulating signal transducer with metallopeptidase domain
MTILTWLAVYSLVWGGLIWAAGRLLQGTADISGRARQWMWRGATVLLIAPWIAAPVVAAAGWGLAPSESAAPAAGATLATLAIDTFTGEQLLDFTGAPAPATINLDLTQIVLMVLAAGWIVRFVLAQYAGKSLMGVVAASRPAEPGRATVALQAWSKRLGMKRAPRLRIVSAKVSPFSFGVLRPTICLPEGLEDELSREALSLVVGHECLHVARGDGWRRPLERITADVMWFNPAAWLIRRELDVARELACDEGMVELSSARTAYARTLRAVAGFSAGLSHAAPAASMSLAGGRSLMLRVKRTLGSAKRKPARAAVAAAVLMGVLGAPIAVAQVAFVIPAPPTPPAPPAAPEAPAAAGIDADGSVRSTFAGKITAITGGAQNGFNVRLEGKSDEGTPCVADMNGLVSVAVTKGQAIAENGLIGKRVAGRNLRVSVQCTDSSDGKDHSSLAIPPAPPAPVELAQLAIPAPKLNVNPNVNANVHVTPVPAPAPLAAPAPPAPMAMPAPPTAVTPAVPAAPLSPLPPVPSPTGLTPPAPPAPLSPPAAASPLAPVSPEAPLAPRGISYQPDGQVLIIDRHMDVQVRDRADDPVTVEAVVVVKG